ncbi:carbon-nitrogen hydrolase family protein [Shewanella psychropiezotolerans]|uniref:Carbon-nitrogen hydrolase family protein n=1 Tax=Shewanella psychropiezotolerans TaxID=2593655 RepID=A0ABX5WSY3_9GAMM|nr:MULTISPECIES: carbon-nitrogen hydrolase family protein [Shewanella]MPY25900.1 carbon-nitrogen hydrolase family protein [Shewanella sp. YLB-07]QDO82225.1 carbon-nitrogen hydrolase family protein [Shewanella psychropiezotolerans]
MQINLLQCQSSQDVSKNLEYIESQLSQLPRVQGEAQLVVLPECCLLFGGHESQQLEYAGDNQSNPFKTVLADLARRYDIYLVAGSIPVAVGDGRVYNRTYLFDNQGLVLGEYDKIHLFDVDVSDGTKEYRESDTFCAGDKISVIDTPFGKLGLAICYDLRFPDLFRAMRLAGAELIALPAAFTKVTGEAHWQTLIQARAIENQCFILAAAQWGQHNQGGRETWGQSMVVDPWGRINAQKMTGCGWVQSKLDRDEMIKIRQQMPIASNNRFAEPKLQHKDANP